MAVNLQPEVTDSQFRTELITKYRILEMPGDGNCLFSAFALVVYGCNTRQLRCRKEVKTYIEDNMAVLQEFLDLTEPEVSKEFEDMNDDGSWSGDVALFGACNCYNFIILLEQPGLPTRTFDPIHPAENPTTVHLSYHNKNHYNFLIPKNSPPINSHSQSEVTGSQDSEGSFSSDNNVLATEGFSFAACGFFKKARDDLAIAVLVPVASLKYDTLLEAIQKEKPILIRFVTLYNRGDVSKLLSDADVKSRYTVYLQNFKLPVSVKYHKRPVWLAEALIVPLLLSVLGYKWRNLELSVLCNKSILSTTMHLLNRDWGHIGDSVMREINYIIAHPDSFFCVKCKSNCSNFGKPWHTDLNDYLLQEISNENDNFLDSFSTAERPNMLTIAPVWNSLAGIQFSNSSLQHKLKALTTELDKNCSLYKDDWYATYLVLHLDGKGIEKYGSNEIYEMMLDNKIKKSVYVGTTTNERFRTHHFRNRGSSIFKVLTKTSMLFYIRSKTFATEIDAREDEGVLIETLKCYLNMRWQKEKVKPFLLLNRKSESRQLNRTGPAEVVKVNEFVRFGIPIIRRNPLFTRIFNWSRFSGNFEISEPIPMLDGPYNDRNFMDADIKKHYQWLESQIFT